MYRKQVRRRRAVLVLLIVISLILLSAEFSEGDSGPLHAIQRGVAAALAPVEEGASRALKPATDLFNWVDETFDARGENSDLKAEVQDLRTRLTKAQEAISQNKELTKLVGLDRSGKLAGYTPVTSRVIGRSPTVWYSTVTIDRGSSSHVDMNDPVVTGDGLVGRVTDTTSGSARVTLITDHQSAVSARVLPTGPEGVIEPEVGDPGMLLLDFIENEAQVDQGAILATAGWSNGQISSAFPPGLPIGKITQATTEEQQTYQSVRVQPFADFRDMQFVQVLTRGPARPGVSG